MIKIKIFGKLTDVFGGTAYDFQIKEIKDVAHLCRQLEQEIPSLFGMTYLVVINGKKADDDTIIPEIPEIALLPPYSGG